MHNFIYENHRCFGCWSVYLETLRAYLSVPCPGATFQSLGNIPTDRKWSVLYPWVVQLAWSPYSWYVIAVQQSFTAFKSVSDVESVILFISALCIRHTECIGLRWVLWHMWNCYYHGVSTSLRQSRQSSLWNRKQKNSDLLHCSVLEYDRHNVFIIYTSLFLPIRHHCRQM